MENIKTFLKDSALYVPALQLVFGIFLIVLKKFTVSEVDFRQRKNFLKEQVIANISEKHKNILNNVFRGYSDVDDSTQDVSPMLHEFTKYSFHWFQDLLDIEKLYNSIKKVYTIVFVTIILAILLFLIAFLSDNAKLIVSMMAIIIVIVQLIILCILRNKGNKLEKFENKL